MVCCCAYRYALVGLEQTAESTCLPEFRFPSKTVRASPRPYQPWLIEH